MSSFSTCIRLTNSCLLDGLTLLYLQLPLTALTASLLLDAIVEPDVWVEPKYVITVAADEITRSPMHTCGKRGSAGSAGESGGDELPGYALRFPRMVQGIRKDKGVGEATTVDEIVKMYGMQKRIGLEG